MFHLRVVEKYQQMEKPVRKGKYGYASIEVCAFLATDSNQFDDVPLQNGGDTSWQADSTADLAFKRQNKPRSTKPQDFQVSLTIHFVEIYK